MKIFLITMGCAKNSVDSEVLMGRLAADGHKFVDDVSKARVGIINTCGFIQDAVKENINAILDLEQLKEQGKLDKIIVVGCLVNRCEAELREALPTVDLFARAESWEEVAVFLAHKQRAKKAEILSRSNRLLPPGGEKWTRYLKVGEGCDTFCSFCSIPFIRGRLRSTPVQNLVTEAVSLAADGAREICLVGQDLTVYGRDIYGKPAIETLLKELDSALPDDTWIRLLYLHPDRVTPEFVDFISGSKKILPYLDIPIQHIDDSILVRMNRGPVSGHIKKIFRYIRSESSLFTIRSTIMTGFPGETEEQFQHVLDFLEEIKLDRVGAFVYSPEEGTKAAKLPDQVPQQIAEERHERLMMLQEKISTERNALFDGLELKILVEETDKESAQAWGRSYRDAPEVDGLVYVDGANNVKPGDFITARITDYAEHDLFGTFIMKN